MDVGELKTTEDNSRKPVDNPDFWKEVRFFGSELVGEEYEPITPFFADTNNSFKVLDGDFVTTEDGTGVVHIAPGFGEDDNILGKKNGVPVLCPVDDAGCFKFDEKRDDIEYKLGDKDEVLHLNGKQVFDTQDDIIKYLKSTGAWIKTEQFLHNYPHCWRTDTPLIYRALPSWYVKVTNFKDRMCELNKQINWIPSHIRDGQFGKWLENARDWSITRNRFWGAPVPVWRIKYRNHIKLNAEDNEDLRNTLIEKYIELHPELEGDREQIMEYYNAMFGLHYDEYSKIVDNTIKIAKKDVENDLRNLLLNAIESGLHVKIHPGFQNNDEFDKIIYDKQECLREIEHIVDFELGDGALAEDGFGNVQDVDVEYDFEIIPNSIKSLENFFKDDYIADFKAGKNSGKYVQEDGSFKITDLHRPYVDELVKHTEGGDLKRVEDVLDCWFESGSMPFASVHYPFENEATGRSVEENKKWFDNHFPCDFVTEYVAQTRGWFYTMLVLSTALFDKIPFKNVIAHGVVLDINKQKLSKRLRNYPDPLEMIDVYGSDAMRWMMCESPVMIGGDLQVDKDGQMFADVVKAVINPVWNAFSFFKQYAELDKIKISNNAVKDGKIVSKNKMDVYILSSLQEFKEKFVSAMDKYDTITACAEAKKFINTLNDWYIRRSKERFWKSEQDEDKQLAYETLHLVLKEFCVLVSPLLPFLTEEIYQNLAEFEK